MHPHAPERNQKLYQTFLLAIDFWSKSELDKYNWIIVIKLKE